MLAIGHQSSGSGAGARLSILIVTILCAALLFALLAPPAAEAAVADSAKASFLVVNKSTNELAYFKDGELVRVFPVATGKTDDLTPEGTFPIVNKIKNRPYYKEKIPGGDPANPLGNRWLGLRVGKTEGTTYAIHGNNNESSIGKYVSAGCIRMHNADIEWLFEQLEVGTRVAVVDTDDTFEQTAEKNGYALLQPFAAALSIDGEIHELPVQPLLYQGVSYAPVRALFERLGADVLWDDEARAAKVQLGERTLEIRPGKTEAQLDASAVPLAAAARIVGESLFVPIRDAAVLSGKQVHWDAERRTIFIQD